MDVFDLRERVVGDYAEYVRSFFDIRDPRIRDLVDQELASGRLWPEPLLQLNPAFERGGTVDELVKRGVLDARCSSIFRVGKEQDGIGHLLSLHRHQTEAILAAKRGANYVLTTGTGSGKSLAYILPIVDLVLREGSGKGVRAIVVYPMNALANSQMGELEKFLGPAGSRLVTFGRYTGQEQSVEKQRFVQSPPDILLTNFVMLELILTRAKEHDLVRAATDLRFLALDELHTYRGRQGSDVALLVRRVREALNATRLQCVGTSATLAGPGTPAERRVEVAAVATTLFGAPVHPSDVIGETLRRSTPPADPNDAEFRGRLKARVMAGTPPPKDHAGFVADPLAAWIESRFGVTPEKTTGELVRAEPCRIDGPDGAAVDLATTLRLDQSTCAAAIRRTLLEGAEAAPDPTTGFPPFAFRLHQFVSRGDTVHATLGTSEDRYLTLEKQKNSPNGQSVLLPLVFCRECGHEYYCVRQTKDPTGTLTVIPRELSDRGVGGDESSGFLFRASDPEFAWPTHESEQVHRVPDDWTEDWKGTPRIKTSRRKDLPRPLEISPEGRIGDGGAIFHWISAPFRFCLCCGVVYSGRQASDFAKLTSLGTEGRSTATTVTTLSAVRHLRRTGKLPADAQKLLSFTDNRQDASLQAGHFNDFVQVGLLRAGLYRAVRDADPDGIRHEVLAERVLSALALPVGQYAQDPEVRYAAREDADRALREVLAYRLYLDLRRGWRITSPNLEQCGLLEISYRSLPEVCGDDALWRNAHPALAGATPEVRRCAGA